MDSAPQGNHDSGEPAPSKRQFERELQARHPPFSVAVLSDARVTSANRGRSLAGLPRWRVALEAVRLGWQSDGFLAQAIYRAKARTQALGIPVLPRLLHRASIMISGLYIGDPVWIEPGVHLAHGQIVIDGITEIGRGTTIFPFTTIGLRAGPRAGPRIGRNVTVGSGSRILGPVEIGERAQIGANAVVVVDVDAGQTVVGVPARPIRSKA